MVVALTRNIKNSELLKLQNQFTSRLRIIEVDLESFDSIDHAAKTICLEFPRVDVLLNVAGILGNGTTDLGPERTVSNISSEWMKKSFQV